jgi:hypothetical protein
MRLQRSVLFQPLLPPPFRPDADRCARALNRGMHQVNALSRNFRSTRALPI